MKRRSLFALALACGLAASGCTRPDPVPENRLVVAASTKPDTLDPLATTHTATSQALLYNVYETLVRLDAEGRIRPLLAESWTVSSNGLTYTFVLKENLTFASGTTIDADSVVTSIERVRTSSQVDPALREHMSIVSKVVEVDPLTVTVVLKRRSDTWLRHMTQAAGIIVDPGGGDRATTTAGSGPYKLRDFDGYLTLERNDNYWADKAHFDAVVFRYLADPAMKNDELIKGVFDVDADADPAVALHLPEGYQVIRQPSDGDTTKTVIAKPGIVGIPAGAYGDAFDLTHVRRD